MLRKPPVESPSRDILKLPLEQRAEMAMKAAVRDVIAEHARTGLPLVVWSRGKVVELPPAKVRALARKQSSKKSRRAAAKKR